MTRQEDAQIAERLNRIEELLVRPSVQNLEQTESELEEVLRIFESSESPTVSARNRVSIRRIGLLLGQAGRLRLGIGLEAGLYQPSGERQLASAGSAWRMEA